MDRKLYAVKLSCPNHPKEPLYHLISEQEINKNEPEGSYCATNPITLGSEVGKDRRIPDLDVMVIEFKIPTRKFVTKHRTTCPNPYFYIYGEFNKKEEKEFFKGFNEGLLSIF